jgi:hypothetical protein
MQAAYDAKNPAALKRLVAGGAKLRPFSREILEAAYEAAMELYGELSAKNPNWKKVYEDYAKFRDDQHLWFRFTEAGFDNFMQTGAVAGFDFPAPTIALGQILGLEAATIQQRGQQNTLLPVGGNHPYGTGRPVFGQRGCFGAGLRRNPHAHEAILLGAGEPFPLCIGFGGNQVMPLLSCLLKPKRISAQRKPRSKMVRERSVMRSTSGLAYSISF